MHASIVVAFDRDGRGKRRNNYERFNGARGRGERDSRGETSAERNRARKSSAIREIRETPAAEYISDVPLRT